MSPMTDANAELMEPIAALINASPKDLPTKVGVLLDSAAALLAMSPRMRKQSELRLTADEMRKRFIRAVRMHQVEIDARQKNAMTAYSEGLKVVDRTPFPAEQGL